MKKIIGEILNTEETPQGIKDRLLKSARTYLLLKDIGDLFASNVPKTSLDITSTIVEQKTKTNNKRTNK